MEHTKSKPLSSLIFLPLLLLIFLRPFFSGLAYPALESHYENLLIFLAILTLFIEAKRFRVFPKTFDNFPVLLLLLAYSVTTVYSVNIKNSLMETIKFISFFSVFFMVSQANEKQKNILIKTIVFAASIISLYAIYQYFCGYQHTLDYLKKINSDFLAISSYAQDILIAKRAIGTFPSPNILGGYLIIAFFLSLHTAFNQGNKPGLKLIPPVLISVALILTKSMGAWLSLISGLIILFIISYKSIKHQKSAVISSIVFICLILTFILITRWERLMDLGNPQNSITQRLNYWRTSFAIIKNHPFLGIGPGNFHELFLKYKVGFGTNTRYAHNLLLHTWTETGILGLAGIVYLILNFFRKFKTRPGYRLVFFGGFAFILHNLIDNTYFISQVGLFWWVLLGLLQRMDTRG